MPKRMLIDAAHPEETRVVVTSGTRLEEFDFESSTKRQVKGNIYLAKVTRVEPSLQAAFIDYGGNRHGFLAFSEIHPDYYRIPVSDRHSGDADSRPTDATGGDELDAEDPGMPLAAVLPEPVAVPDSTAEDEPDEPDRPPHDFAAGAEPRQIDDTAFPSAMEEHEVTPVPAWEVRPAAESDAFTATGPSDEAPIAVEWEAHAQHEAVGDSAVVVPTPWDAPAEESQEPSVVALQSVEESVLIADIDDVVGDEDGRRADSLDQPPNGDAPSLVAEGENVETFGGDEVEEADAERRRSHSARHYKIQEVIKRRQIMLVQVAKEERGNKGAALTTYLSLAGRYCVLMPNTNRGGGVSRKITSIADRRRLKDILEDLEIPEGMGVIVRTAGAERSKAEIKRDYEYLLRLWNEIRELTLKSTAPALIYEEGNLIKRSIRDLYARDIDEVLVEGEEGYRTAKAFMRTLTPSHAKRVQPYRDPQIGLFHRFQIESQIDAIHSPVAQLRSGGYVVINQTEALVAIDVNSGRSTRERNIEETALRTNLEAAEELARQLRLRDLAGLIVIDFIDMEEHRNQIAVERRLKDALKNDRARIQVGRISPFGLMEMSRQRLRPSLAEASTQPCPHCGGTGFIRSVESTALYVLRSIEEEGIRRRSAEVCIYVPTNVALYILNQKRESLNQIEARYGIRVIVSRDDTLIPPNFRLERLRAFGVGEAPPIRAIQAPTLIEEEEPDEVADEETEAAEAAEAAPEQGSDEERARRRRSRRRRRPKEAREGGVAVAAPEEGDAPAEASPPAPRGESEEAERRRRRRGRRGGRVRPHREEAAEATDAHTGAAEQIEVVTVGDMQADAADEGEGVPELETWSAEAGLETASLAPLAGETVEPVPAVHEAISEPEPPPTAEAEPGIPFASPAEQVLENAITEAGERAEPVAAALAARPSEDVRAVTEKPENPRRGWWQRLIQP